MASSSTSSSSQTWDLTSGQDAAYKMGQEKSSLKAKQMADLYGMDVGAVLASTNRIRDIQRYLQSGGYGDMEVIPRARMSSMTTSQSSTQSFSPRSSD